MPTFQYDGKTLTIDHLYSYARVSSDYQTIQSGGDGIPRQLKLHQDFATEFNIPTEDLTGSQLQFIDEAKSGSKGAHLKAGAGLAAFLAMAKAGKLKSNPALTVESFTRLGRLPTNRAQPLFFDIINAGVVLLTLKDRRAYTVESINKDKGQIYQVSAMMQAANAYSEDLAFYVGKSWDKRRGTPTGMSPAWCDKYVNGVQVTHFKGLITPGAKIELRLNKDKTKIVRRICCDLILQFGYDRVSQVLNSEGVPLLNDRKRKRTHAVWDETCLGKIVRSRSVLGEQVIGKYENGIRTVTGQSVIAYPAVISEAEWYAMQQAIDSRKKGTGRMDGRKLGQMTNIFGDLAKCSVCGNRMTVMTRGKGTQPYLACGMGKHRKQIVCNSHKYHRLDRIERAVIRYIAEYALQETDKVPDDPAQAIQDQCDSLVAETARLETQFEAMWDEYSLQPVGSPERNVLDKRSAVITANKAAIKKLESAIMATRATKPVSDQFVALRGLLAGLGALPEAERITTRGKIAAALPGVVAALQFDADGDFSIRMVDGLPCDNLAVERFKQQPLDGDYKIMMLHHERTKKQLFRFTAANRRER